MGLKKINYNGETAYMHTYSEQTDGVSIVLLKGEVAFTAKLNTESDAVIKWSHNLQKPSQEYIDLLQISLENYSKSTSNGKQDVFEVQEDCLVWKQYFPDKNVYGRRGRFALEKINYEEAVNVILNGTISDLELKSHQIQQLTEDLDKKSKELQDAKALAVKSVTMKEEFEQEIYGKFVAILNAKKLRIRQLMSNRPSTSGEQSSSSGSTTLTDTKSASKAHVPAKSIMTESDGYSSDTDVDDPDTDEENAREAATQSQKKKTTAKSNPPKKSVIPKRSFDSQDLFNNSLDAELYAPVVTKKQKVEQSTKGKIGPKRSGRMEQNILKVTNGSNTLQNCHGKSEPESNNSKSFSQDMKESDTQSLIINELF